MSINLNAIIAPFNKFKFILIFSLSYALANFNLRLLLHLLLIYLWCKKKDPLWGLDGESRPVTALRLCPASSQAPSACSDHSLQNRSQDGSATLVPQGVRLSPTISENKKWAPVGTHFYFHGGGGAAPSIITEKGKWIDFYLDFLHFLHPLPLLLWFIVSFHTLPHLEQIQ